MESADTRVLTSWKEIAGHLDVTVRTAQLWEKQRGLPVRRMPGPRGRVYLRIDEYEAWLASADDEPNQDATDAGDGQAAKPGSTASGNSDWRLWPLVAGVAVISLLVGVVAAPRLLRGGRAVVPSSAGVPAQALVRDGILIVLNAAGDELWRKEFDRGLEQGLYDEGKLHATIADIDGDGTVEVLFPRQSADGIIADDLICYSQAGDEIWRFRPGADGLANDKQTFENVFRVAYHEPVDLGGGRRMIVVSSIHYINEPTQIALLDVHGRLFAEYWHAGHIAHRPGSLDIADVDGDGRKEIYAVGVNNARQRATLVILDPDTMSGASNEPRGFQLRGFDTDGALARVFFPRSSMNLAENQYNFAEGVFPGADGIVVSTVELYNSDDSPGIIHRLDLDLVLRDISFGDTFRSTHAKLVRQGAIDPITLEEELQMLWQQGIEVLRPGSDSIANGGCP